MVTDALGPLLDDLAAEEVWLDGLVAGLDEAGWSTPTPAQGWAVRDQVTHLAQGEELAAMALEDSAAFASTVAAMLGALDRVAAEAAEQARRSAGAAILARWRAARARTLVALQHVGADDRIPWVTGMMSARSFASARLMETWAHGQDVAEGVGVDHPPSLRLRPVAHLGVATRRFSFINRGLTPPEGDVRVVLDAPDGTTWTWGATDATDRVSGTAFEFCLVVTQRRRVEDTSLVVEGGGAVRWLAIAQAFAGPPTSGQARRPV